MRNSIENCSQKNLCFEITQNNLELVTPVMKMCLKRSLPVTSHGFTIVIPKQNNSLTVEVFIYVTTEKSSFKSDQCQDLINCFLWLWKFCGHEYAPRGQIINKTFYVEVLKELHDHVRIKWSHFWTIGNYLFHHDNATALTLCNSFW